MTKMVFLQTCKIYKGVNKLRANSYFLCSKTALSENCHLLPDVPVISTVKLYTNREPGFYPWQWKEKEMYHKPFHS
jgi:hypothetical protein